MKEPFKPIQYYSVMIKARYRPFKKTTNNLDKNNQNIEYYLQLDSCTPISIMLSPLTIGFLTALLIFTTLKIGYRILLITLAVIVNDLCIKKFAGGTHDLEGAGFINAFLIIGLIISTIIILIKTVVLKNTNTIIKIMLILAMPVIVFLYLQYFEFYGLSFPRSMSFSKQEAIESKTFIADLNFSEREIVYEQDSIHIISGWTEKQIKMNHNSLLSKTEETGNINYTISIKHNFEPQDVPFIYQVNSDNVNGASGFDTILNFTAPKSEHITLTFFRVRTSSDNNDTIISRVIIKP